MNGEQKNQPLISIIVPVYNAEKYLGYCLNSLLAQTYTHFEIVLINDGSKDSSLEICRNYAALDTRIQVTSIPNGGVSNARNTGVAQAKGDYFVFQDSDDVLAPDALQLLMDLEQKYHTGFVVGDVQQVDFDKKKVLPVRMDAGWTGDKAYYNREEFAENRMRLIYFTALLEGPYAKLYDARIWRREGVSFPPELSLGEDFVANMKFFENCNGMALVKRVIHYYNNPEVSESLTHKYRPDLFENKMILNRKMAEHLGGVENISEEEKIRFYEYTAATGLRAMETLLRDQEHVTDAEKAEKLEKMMDHELFRESLEQAPYISPEFESWLPLIREKKPQELMALFQLCDEAEQPQQEESVPIQEETVPVQEENPQEQMPQQDLRSLPNKAIGKCLRAAAKLMGDTEPGRKAYRMERMLYHYGIRYTWNAYSTSVKRRCGLLPAEQAAEKEQNDQQAQTASASAEQAAEKAQNDQQAQTASASAEQAAEKEQNDQQVQAVPVPEHKSDGMQEQLEALVKASAQEGKEYTYIVEQRIMAYLQRNRVNELRQMKKALIVGSAEHGNIGDSAITLAEQEVLLEQYPGYFQMEFSTYEIDRQYEFLQAIVNHQDIIFLNGGGNLGDRYLAEEELRRRIITDFPEQKIVILPQTISFSDTPEGRRELEKSKKIYNSHRDLTIFTRGRRSLDFAREHFTGARTELMPDMVFALRRNYSFDREGVLLCLRTDEEGVLDQNRSQVIETVGRLTNVVEETRNCAPEDVSRERRAIVVNEELKRHARRKAVVTDRLHGVIFAAITSTPVVVFKSADHKIEEFCQEFFADSNAVFYIGDDFGRLEETLERAMRVEKAEYPIFEKNPLSSLRERIGG